MAHPFEIVQETTVGATPEQVWDAITQGPQIDSWFMGRNTIEPRAGGAGRMEHGLGFAMESTVRFWEPPTRLALRTEAADDGAFHDFEYQIEERPEITTVRWVHTGALGDDWEAEYAAMSEGDPMYFRKLIEYLTYFPGRTGVPVDAFGANIGAGSSWEVFREPLGLQHDPEVDQPVALTPDGLDRIEGVTDHLSKSFFGVRTDDALYRFIVGFEGSTMVGHHLFAEDVDRAAATEAWQTWITRALG